MGYEISYDHLVGWEVDLRLLTERVAGSLFTRPEPRATFADLVRGLLADVPRKNSWQLAEHVGHGSAYRLEWLLGGAKWDADALRDRVRDYVVATLGAEDGVLIADDTQVIKKGRYCSRSGRRRRGGEEARHQDRPANARAGVRRFQRAAGSAIAGWRTRQLDRCQWPRFRAVTNGSTASHHR